MYFKVEYYKACLHVHSSAWRDEPNCKTNEAGKREEHEVEDEARNE